MEGMNLDDQAHRVEDDGSVGALPWKFSQCFGEKTAVEEMTEGESKSNQITFILFSIEFSKRKICCLYKYPFEPCY